MRRALLVEGSAALALDGAPIGTLRGRGETLTLDVQSLGAALRVARSSGGSFQRNARLRQLEKLSRESGVRFAMSVRGRTVAQVRVAEGKPLQLRPGAILRSLLPG